MLMQFKQKLPLSFTLNIVFPDPDGQFPNLFYVDSFKINHDQLREMNLSDKAFGDMFHQMVTYVLQTLKKCNGGDLRNDLSTRCTPLNWSAEDAVDPGHVEVEFEDLAEGAAADRSRADLLVLIGAV
jgi:hypothetical protein